MKTNIRFISGLVKSPVLEVESNLGLNPFIGQFLTTIKQTDPSKIMIDFIAAALKTKSLSVYQRITPLSIHKEVNLPVVDISVRKADIVEFVYHKDDGSSSWRKVDVLEEDSLYIKGNDIEDDLKFKCFKKKLIVGGRVIRQGKN